MNKVSMEDIMVNLICYGGEARGLALKAISAAAENNFEEADNLIKQCDEMLEKTHKFQTELLHQEALAEEQSENKVPISLLMVHGQDHLMNAMTVRDLAERIIYLSRKNEEREKYR